MDKGNGERAFSGPVPQFYQQYMVPMLFEPYAADLSARAAALEPRAVLEVAAGTGTVTRHLARLLPASLPIVATDLNPAMLTHAQGIGTCRAVTWRQADATQLPFEEEAFDVVVCQFGYMFLPDKVAAFKEARRMLRPGGTLLFSTWGRLEDNEFADTVTHALAALWPQDPPRFMACIPHGYHERQLIAEDVARAGFSGENSFETLTLESHAPSPEFVALGFCQGTPIRNEIEARDARGLDKVTASVAAAIQTRHGAGPVVGKMRAHVIAAPAVA